MNFIRIVFICLFLFIPNAKAKDLVEVKSYTNLNENNLLEVLVEFDIAPKWHIFAPYEQEFGAPLKMIWTETEPDDVLEESFSKTKRYTQDMISFDGYESKAFYKSVVNADNKEYVDLNIKWMVCHDECINQEKSIKIYKNTHPEFADKLKQSLEYFLSDDFSSGIGNLSALLMAFVGGIILNLMPCVFPVLGIKIISLANMTEEQRCIEAVFYGLGVVTSMLIIAALLFVLKRFDSTVGWGFHMQSSWFVGFMLVVFIILVFLMLDIVNINNRWFSKCAFLHFNNNKINAFMTGLLAVVIATPCTAPFMGSAVAYALMAPAYIYFPVFFSLGLGYSLPFALLAWNPLKMKSILPKPGKWMNVLKKALAIPLVLTCFWLLNVLLSQLGFVVSGKNLNWQDYDASKVEQALENKQPVFIDFTAKWCITCLVNKQSALQSDTLVEIAKNKNILLLRADATNKDKKVARALNYYGRASVPLYIYYDGKSDDYLILPQILTGEILKEYLQ